MRRNAMITGVMIVALLGAALSWQLALTANAQSGGGYDLSWSTVDGGGTTFATGGGYTLGATAGQAEAGSLRGGKYVLLGGFWGYAPPDSYLIYLPIVRR